MLKFNPIDHSYTGLGVEWTGVTTFVNRFKQPFDAVSKSEGVSKKKTTWDGKPNPWYGMDPAVIREHWKRKSDDSLTTGRWFHDLKEAETHLKGAALVNGNMLQVIPSIMEDGIKVAPNQVLTDGIYPEHFVYMKSAALCGQADLVTVDRGIVTVEDYKTSKEIERTGWQNSQGETRKMMSPINDLDDCNFIHYALQLSLYMYIILRNNPRHKPGRMFIHHVIFDEGEEGPLKERTIRTDAAGNPIIKQVIPIEVPYLRYAVTQMIACKNG